MMGSGGNSVGNPRGWRNNVYVRTLYADGAAVGSPTWPQIEVAIRKLRSPSQSVCLSAHPDGEMTIFQLHGPGTYLVVGPGGVYPKRPDGQGPTDRVSLEAALRAARAFLERGELDASLRWHHPGDTQPAVACR
jgi:hypothetical protein